MPQEAELWRVRVIEGEISNNMTSRENEFTSRQREVRVIEGSNDRGSTQNAQRLNLLTLATEMKFQSAAEHWH